MPDIQHSAINTRFTHLTDSELERFCYHSYPDIPLNAQKELLQRFGASMPKERKVENKYK